MRRPYFDTAVLVFLLAGWGVGFAMATHPPDTILEGMLRKLNRVAMLYRDTALEFSCHETMTGSDLGRRKLESTYMYLYDEGSGFRDYRTRRVNGRQVTVDLEIEGPDRFLQRPYSWIFVFGSIERHRFLLLGRRTVLGRPSYDIEFAPKPPISAGINDWYGHAWVDAETYQILKVEAIPADQYGQYEGFRGELARATEPPDGYHASYSFETVTTEFTVVENGMRFPGRVVISRSEYVFPGGKEGRSYRVKPRTLVTQTYDDYRFFEIRTEDEIRQLVLAEP